MDKLRQLIEAVIYEGVLEREVTQISREIVDTLKLKISKNGGYVRSFKFRLPAPETVNAKKIEVSVKRGFAEDVPTVSGVFVNNAENQERNTVKIMIEVPKGWSDFNFMLSQLSMLIPELKDMLRHELEHSSQTPEDWDRMDKQDLETPEGVEKYYLDPSEVSAHVAGMYKLAKTAKKDLGKVLLDRHKEVYGFMRNAGADGLKSSDVARRVLAAWREYARTRFPSARL